ncbi:radical SAM protein [Candidatus Roizmanbacteria bacterium]|nr:radical SAM protein [Candidatus Roizmanbacteria bacterium]
MAIAETLNPRVFFVEGARRAALYDTTRGNVYSLNQEAAQSIKGEKDNQEFWQRLSSMGLALDRQNLETESVTPELEIPKPNLRFAWLEITDQCNERCLHCYGGFSPNRKEKTAQPLTYDYWRNVIQQLSKNGCQQIQFIGGEPFRYHDETKTQTVLNLAEFARETGVDFVEIFTNGTLISQEAVKRLKDLGVQIALSFYSSEAAIHDTITQTPGSYKKTLRAINMLKEADVPVRAAVIIMKQNEETIEQTLEMTRNLGLNIRAPDVVRPSGRAQETNIMPDIKTLLKYGLLQKPNFSTDPVSFRRNHLYNTCLAGKIAIATDGKVMPCIFSRKETLGNIKNQELEEILQSPTVKETWELTKDKVLVCKDCEYRYACFDCRPLASDSSCGKNYSSAPAPRCTYDPYSGEWGSGIWRINNHGEIIYEKLQIQN